MDENVILNDLNYKDKILDNCNLRHTFVVGETSTGMTAAIFENTKKEISKMPSGLYVIEGTTESGMSTSYNSLLYVLEKINKK